MAGIFRSSLQQCYITLADKVFHIHSLAGILLGQCYHKLQVCGSQFLYCLGVSLRNALSQSLFLVIRKQSLAAYLVEVNIQCIFQFHIFSLKFYNSDSRAPKLHMLISE